MRIKKLAKLMGLSDSDIEVIFKKFKRDLTETEVYIFSAQWSEHCGYRHSKKLLKKEFGDIDSENAGYIKIGDKAIVFKVESHNHPSAIEPFQGAATGIGGIVRDILAMGAKPIALLDLIKFGEIEDNHSRNLFEGVVDGISNYGNSIGVPTIGGQTTFDKTYKTNPIVNVMCIGIADENKLKSSKSDDENGLLAYIGSKTGRDGIHGASFASKTLKGKEDRVSVQIGDPFAEKNLIDATLEISNLSGVIAIQDMGAAGLLSSSSEIAYKSNCGCEINIDKVPLREKGMAPWEILLSESQERMLLVIKEDTIEKLKKIAYKYYLDFEIIGKLTNNNRYKVIEKNKIVADIEIDFLVNAPSKYYDVDFKEIEKSEFVRLRKLYINIINGNKKSINKMDKSNKKYIEIKNRFTNLQILQKLIEYPDFSSHKWVYEQYDYMIQNNTVLVPGYNSAVLWIKNTTKGFATNIVDNYLQTYLDPFYGSFNLVFNAARKIVAVGGIPAGITDNLNFGNPEKKEVMFQFSQSVKGIASACKKLKIPVVSGNISFYNEIIVKNKKSGIYPTPVIGMVGRIENINKIMTGEFKNINDRVYLIGKTKIDREKIGGSYFLKIVYDIIGGQIDVADPDLELKLYKLLQLLIEKSLVNSISNVSKGGLLYWIFKSLVNTEFGFEGFFENDPVLLFGENQSRFIVSVSKEFENQFISICKECGIEYKFIGIVTPKNFVLNYGNEKEEIDVSILKKIYFETLEKHMETGY